MKDWSVRRTYQKWSFLLLAGYCLKFVQDFSKIVGVLPKLISDGQMYVWITCDLVFKELK